MTTRLPQPPLEYDPREQAELRRDLELAITRLEGGLDDLQRAARVTDVFLSFDDAGQLLLTVECNKDTLSFRYALSSTDYPSVADVEAADLRTGSAGDFTEVGPYQPGDTVYVSVIPYRGVNGDGNAGEKYDQAATRGVLVYNQCTVRVISQTDATVTVQVDGTNELGAPAVKLVNIGGTITLNAGAALGVPVPSGSQWTFNRGGTNKLAGSATFRAEYPSTVFDEDTVTIPADRDTTYLSMRARVVATTPTQLVVRVAVADPYPQGANSATITYTTTGVTAITPASGQTVTPAASITEGAGTFVDFTIDREPNSSATGRVVFTAAAANRNNDTDSVDVPGQKADFIAMSGSFTPDGGFILSISADTQVQSLRFATSTTAYPSLAVTQAAAVVNARNVTVTSPGPFNIGTTVYVSLLVYSALAGGGRESAIFQYQMTREGYDVRVQEKATESGTTGTVQLFVTDPTGRVSAVEARTQTGRGAWTAFTAMTLISPGVYEATVSMVEKIPSKINWRVLGTSQTGQAFVGLFENVVTFAMGPIPMEPVVEATVRADGTVDVTVIGDSDTNSLQVGFSTVSAAAADAALGSTVNARQTVFLNVGAMNLGGRGYLSVRAFSGAGASGSASIIARAEVIATSGSATKTLNISPGELLPLASNTVVNRSGGGVYIDMAGPVTGQPTLGFTLPEGCTITNFESFMYDDGAAAVRASCVLYRVDTTGGLTTLATQTAGGTGWVTTGTGLSESTTSNRYQIVFTLTNTAIDRLCERAGGARVTYTSPNTGRTI